MSYIAAEHLIPGVITLLMTNTLGSCQMRLGSNSAFAAPRFRGSCSFVLFDIRCDDKQNRKSSAAPDGSSRLVGGSARVVAGATNLVAHLPNNIPMAANVTPLVEVNAFNPYDYIVPVAGPGAGPACACGQWYFRAALCNGFYQSLTHRCGARRTKSGITTAFCPGKSTRALVAQVRVNALCPAPHPHP